MNFDNKQFFADEFLTGDEKNEEIKKFKKKL